MGEDKRGQFFLLAAVIISVIVISLGATTNRVLVQNNFQDVNGLSYKIEREVGEVLNYEIYNVTSEGKVENFASLVSEDIKDQDPDMDFVFIFGSYDGVDVSNYGESDVSVVTGEIVNGIVCAYSEDGKLVDHYYIDGLDNKICAGKECPDPYAKNICSNYSILGGESHVEFECVYINPTKVCTSIKDGDYADSTVGEHDITAEELKGKDNFTVTIDGVDMVFPISDYPQAHLITRKKKDNEIFFANK